MKKCKVLILLFVFCFVILGCFNKDLSSDKDENVMIKYDLKNTKKIKIKKINSTENIKTISDEIKVNEIVDVIISGKIIEEDENIAYIGSSYVFEMMDEKGKIFETIDLFVPYDVPKFVRLNQLNEFYYVDVDKILAICNEI